MIFLLMLPTVISFWVLGAHYLREGNWVMVGACVVMPGLLLMRQRWVVRALQFLLVLGCVEWVLTARELMGERMARQEPFLRMILILGGVGVFCLIAAGLLETGRVKKRYPREGKG
jgi:hypothetical protein